MKKLITPLALAAVAGIVFVTSCQKHDTNETVQPTKTNTELITNSSWKQIQYASDDNGNNKLDSADFKPIEDIGLMDITFYPNYTGVFLWNGLPNAQYSMTWELAENNQDLTLKYDNKIEKYKIYGISTTILILQKPIDTSDKMSWVLLDAK